MHAEQPSQLAADPESREREASLAHVDVMLAHLRPLDGTDALEARVLRRIHATAAPSVGARRTAGVWLGLGIAALTATAVGAWLAGGDEAPADQTRVATAVEAPPLAEAASTPPRVGLSPETPMPPHSPPASPSAAPVVAPTKAAPPPAKAEPTRARAPLPESLLYAAATALRRDRDPSRALELLGELRRDAPSLGARDDARALEVEAHHRLGSPRTRSLAEAYLRDFPNGRFRVTALNVLGGARGAE